MRISGLASGIDTEGIIQDLMRAERIPVDRVYKQKVKTEWKRDAYREVNNKLFQLRNKIFDLRLQSSFSTRKVTSSHPSLISATATGTAIDGEYEIAVKSLAKSARLVTDEVHRTYDQLSDIFGDNDEITVVFKGAEGDDVELTFKKTDNIQDIVKTINDDKRLGFSAIYDEVTGRLVFTTKGTGQNAEIAVLDNEGSPQGLDFFMKLAGFVNEDGNPLGETSGKYEVESGYAVFARGTNARLLINGLETERESNTFTLNGISITLLEEPEKGEDGEPIKLQTVRIGVERDVDAVFNRVKEFVDLYNEIITELNLKLREPINRSYEPLTDEEKEAMNEKEIEKWEEAAKSGLLRSDPIISSILSEMRMVLSEADLRSIGITTGNWQEYGRLHLDEAKFKEAFAEDPEKVMEIFTKVEGSDNVGLAGRLTKVLDGGYDRLVRTAGRSSSAYDTSFLSQQIRDYDKRLEFMEERLARVENRYWNQFIAMERALSELYAQSDWLYQQLAALQG